MNTTLYQLSKDFLQFTLQYEEAETEEERLIAYQALQDLNETFEVKLNNCCGYLKSLDANEAMIDEEITRLKNKKTSISNKAESFKGYMASILTPGQRWTNGVHSIAWRASESVEVLDESLIPLQFMREKVTVTPDKIEIKNHLKIGAEIPGVTLKKVNNLQVK